MRLSQAAEVVKGTFTGKDGIFTGVDIDSRQIRAGQLFVAIPGEHVDGHDYVEKAGENGAIGAMVSDPQDVSLGQITVDDTTQAMGELAKDWRARFEIPVIGVTGSNGKTTVTAMIAAILSESGQCLSPKSSFNNQWGVPLTLLKLNQNHRYAVIEMGMNHTGELDYLTDIVTPTVALINNVAPAHLEGLGDVQAIANAKAEIFNGLTENGIAVLNREDAFYPQWQERLQGREIMTFGGGYRHGDVDVCVQNIDSRGLNCHFYLIIDGRQFPVNLPLTGEHNAMNAAAAAAATLAAGIRPEQIQSGLEKVRAVKGRLNVMPGINGSRVIDDSYNANPASVKSAVDVLADGAGKKLLVLGVMAELGEASPELHEEIGRYVRQSEIDGLYCLSAPGNDLAHSYRRGYGDEAEVFDNLDSLVLSLQAQLADDVTVLVKGSRSSAMERVVKKITDTI